MNRRDLLTASVAATTAAAVSNLPLPAEAATETPIMALYHEHRRITADAAAYDTGGATWDQEDAILDRLFYNRRDAVEAKMMSTPCQTPADFAAKMLIATCDNGLILHDDHPVWAEARALAGRVA